MAAKKSSQRYVALLRGINVGGHHKLPMADLRNELKELGFENVVTLLNSGNVIFDAGINDLKKLEKMISERLEKTFGFPVPAMVRKSKTIHQLYIDAPFQDITITKDIRLYLSFLKKNTPSDLELPWTSSDRSFRILDKRDKTILSVLDLSLSKTPKAMEALEKSFGKDITTRNWKTLERIVKKLDSL